MQITLRRFLIIGSLVAGLSLLPSSASAQDFTCEDFPDQETAQAFFEANGGPQQDPNGLDPDGDGVACETLPAQAPVETEEPEETDDPDDDDDDGDDDDNSGPGGGDDHDDD